MLMDKLIASANLRRDTKKRFVHKVGDLGHCRMVEQQGRRHAVRLAKHAVQLHAQFHRAHRVNPSLHQRGVLRNSAAVSRYHRYEIHDHRHDCVSTHIQLHGSEPTTELSFVELFFATKRNRRRRLEQLVKEWSGYDLADRAPVGFKH